MFKFFIFILSFIFNLNCFAEDMTTELKHTNSLFRQKQYEEAKVRYYKLIDSAESFNKSDAFSNLVNILNLDNKHDEMVVVIEKYFEWIKLNPSYKNKEIEKFMNFAKRSIVKK